jgi:hypothetical protein
MSDCEGQTCRPYGADRFICSFSYNHAAPDGATAVLDTCSLQRDGYSKAFHFNSNSPQSKAIILSTFEMRN